MLDGEMSFELRALRMPEDWDTYHDIRKRILFDARGKGGEYDPLHSDETKPGNHPLIFEAGGQPLGVVRIDLDLPDAWLRRMAVDTPFQRRGFGTLMIAEIVTFCGNSGASRLLSAVAPNAVGFYAKCGFEPVNEVSAGRSIRMKLDVPKA